MRHEFTVEVHNEGGSLWGQVIEEPGCCGTGGNMEELADSIGEALALAGALTHGSMTTRSNGANPSSDA